MEHVPPDGFRIVGRRDSSKVDSNQQSLIDSLTLNDLAGREEFKTRVIDHTQSGNFPTNDDQIMFMVKVVSKLYSLEHERWIETNGGDASGFEISEDLDFLEKGLIDRVNNHYPPLPPILGKFHTEEKIANLKSSFSLHPPIEMHQDLLVLGEKPVQQSAKRKEPDGGFDSGINFGEEI